MIGMKEAFMQGMDAVICLNNMLNEIDYIKLKSRMERINQKLK